MPKGFLSATKPRHRVSKAEFTKIRLPTSKGLGKLRARNVPPPY